MTEIQALWNRAIALHGEAQYREALECLRAIEGRMPGDPRLLSNLGVVLRDSGDLASAERYFRRVISKLPGDAAAHFNLALTLLRAGRLREGFVEYEWRWHVPQFAPQRREFAQALWRGEPLAGRRILLWSEQGAGDGIQFVRFAPLVRAAGGNVVLEMLPHIERLTTWMEGGFPVGNALTPGVKFDVHCPLMSLPQRFGTDLGSIPAPARFDVPAELVSKWAARLRTRRANIGLVWATNPAYGNNAARSAPASLFAGIECWGLQVGPSAGETPDGVVNLGEELVDFAETAAAISALDLVITVDTAVAHLAGSLGKPVWVLLHYASDWRWLLDREDTPWYPTMRLFRQRRPGDWGEVVARVRRELQQ